ncbi:MAG: hypothetical protein FJ215_08065 [Ignavibacteria bacterium]|nr:hypothetical protein [Ignavibacteria bacterium]
MSSTYHLFHIPVMGTGHSIDTPIRVAHFGISSVISIVDDLLLERIREHYSKKHGLPFERIQRYAEDGRARRITAYLNMVKELVHRNMEAVKQLPFFQSNDKAKYFEMLPDTSPLKREYFELQTMPAGSERHAKEHLLTEQMRPGSIDVNIMVKLDKINFTKSGVMLSDEFSDAKAALRGYANSLLESCIVFSAGINQSLFSYIAKFGDFYRNEMGEIRKKIILKVSDFRSALIQGKLMARKGLEVHEFRIESGLNCGGHAFASDGHLLPALLKEFKEKREQLHKEFQPMVLRFYESMGWTYPVKGLEDRPLMTVQGGIGTHGEARRMHEQFGVDRTGWASPFLLVPEATCVDDATRELLRKSKEEDLYVSDNSPLGVPFNNIRGTGSQLWTKMRQGTDTPGSPCPKGFLVSNTEFTQKPICLAATEYQKPKYEQIAAMDVSEEEKAALRAKIEIKECLCEHLGNGALIALGVVPESKSPQSICPGPNIAWFDRIYTLREMVDHIYGRCPSLVPPERPHMFAKEIVMYVDYLERLITRSGRTPKELAYLREFKENLEFGMSYCLELAAGGAYEDEHLASIPSCVEQQRERLRRMSLLIEDPVMPEHAEA